MQEVGSNKRNAPAQQRISFLVYKYFQDCLAEIQGGKAGRLQSAAFQGEILLKFIQGYAFNRIQYCILKIVILVFVSKENCPGRKK
jgi:hypothetical protein